jgi:hypothetical protein
MSSGEFFDMNIKTELLSILEALDAADTSYALCGGLALAVHGHPRFTKDIELKQATGRTQDKADVERLGAV